MGCKCKPFFVNPGDIHPSLQNLSRIEKLLISAIIPEMLIFYGNSGGQRKFKGNVVSYRV